MIVPGWSILAIVTLSLIDHAGDL